MGLDIFLYEGKPNLFSPGKTAFNCLSHFHLFLLLKKPVLPGQINSKPWLLLIECSVTLMIVIISFSIYHFLSTLFESTTFCLYCSSMFISEQELKDIK